MSKIIPPPQRLKIGRADTNDFVVAEPSVSRCHAELEQQADGKFLLEDVTGGKDTHIYSETREAWFTSRLTLVEPETRIRLGNYETTPAQLMAAAGRSFSRAPETPPPPEPAPAEAAAAPPAASSPPPAAPVQPRPLWKRILNGIGEGVAFALVGLAMLVWEVLKLIFSSAYRRGRF